MRLILKLIFQIKSPNKFREVACLSSHFVGGFVFRRSAFCGIFRLFCKISNLQDINLKLSRLISNVDIDNSANSEIFVFRSVIYRLDKICKFWTFSDWVHSNRPCPSISPSLNISENANYFFLKLRTKLRSIK